jgi:ABC-type ATPase with predicted acetyltransferase domain
VLSSTEKSVDVAKKEPSAEELLVRMRSIKKLQKDAIVKSLQTLQASTQMLEKAQQNITKLHQSMPKDSSKH